MGYVTGISYTGDTQVNYVRNYIKHGPNSSDRYFVFINTGKGTAPRLYLEGNVVEQLNGSVDPADASYLVRQSDLQFVSTTPALAAPIISTSAQGARDQVLAGAGATFPARDAVDQRIVDDFAGGTGRIIDDPSDVGGWPVLSSGIPPADSDHDGMPDDWELRQGFNPNDPADGPEDADGDGYTNVEEYLNSLVPTDGVQDDDTSGVGELQPSARLDGYLDGSIQGKSVVWSLLDDALYVAPLP